jgi:acetyltransferase
MSTQPNLTDAVGEFLRSDNESLDAIFTPKTVAVVGATEKVGSVGRTVFWNLIKNPFGGVVFPVNSQRPGVMGIKAYPSVSAVPEKVDLAVICTPARSVPDIIKECADIGIKGAIVISAGFKELGAPGVELEMQILVHARRGKMRIIGPNCLGVMNPLTGLNATFAGTIARPGSVAFISQSGALCTAILDWSVSELVGFSAFVSIGSMVDIDWGDLIYYFGQDSRTESIVIYMESIGSARSFLSAAREIALKKPIIVIKAGRTSEAAKAAASHTGSLTGSDEVLDAAFRRAGVLRVDHIADLFHMAEVLGKQPRPRGPRLSILTNAGGPGVLATDALVTGGGKLAELQPETFQAFNNLLPPHWSRNNPIDILGDAPPERYAKALEIAAKDTNTDGLLVILTPQDMTDPTLTAEQLKPYASIEGKPVIASWMGGPDVKAGIDILNKANIPTYEYPDTAVQTFNYMWQYSETLRYLYEMPMPGSTEGGQDAEPDRAKAEAIIEEAREAGQTILTEAQSKDLLAAYRIPVVQTLVAKTADEAVAYADKIGYPVVLKLYSKTITHKTDVGGVKLDLINAQAVKQAYLGIQQAVSAKAGAQAFDGVTVQKMLILKDGYELILGSSLDPQFGPVLLFGLGGQLVEVFKDRSLGLPPLNRNLVRLMMERTKIFTALKGVRGRKPVDITALEDLMLRFSQLVVEQNLIKESDINPLFASADSLMALDARFVLHEAQAPQNEIARPAIRPYPIQYVYNVKARDGREITIRPITPEDEPRVIEFHRTLSERTVYLRYADHLDFNQRTKHERLVNVCFVDYDRKIVMVAETKDADGERRIVAIGRLNKVRGTNDSQFAVLVADEFQRKGLGTLMMERLLDIARKERILRIVIRVLHDNEGMLHLCKKAGFKMQQGPGERFVTGVLELEI